MTDVPHNIQVSFTFGDFEFIKMMNGSKSSADASDSVRICRDLLFAEVRLRWLNRQKEFVQVLCNLLKVPKKSQRKCPKTAFLTTSAMKKASKSSAQSPPLQTQQAVF